MENLPPVILLIISATLILCFVLGYLLGAYHTSFNKPKSDIKPGQKPTPDSNLGKPSDDVYIPGFIRLSFLVEICQKRKVSLVKSGEIETEKLKQLYWMGRENETDYYKELFTQAIEKFNTPNKL